ncbi:bacteriohopanetetrol glucosamine biosynthesis glycosyltransferase HpnI [Cupriavidus sp. UME77]|uniref:bacteriohopanetetrol glucosamine biosynthesis glycosyltransferase HpnI n=1 Tax=Cupriavidus sp. UME77 TaxID=1862321 RepID=UPI001603B4BD|nr:bacteriohopanetetrol glucosamine biosynthesis glycosyltransferase HpnI [Cupriavidus sp. UME77]
MKRAALLATPFALLPLVVLASPGNVPHVVHVIHVGLSLFCAAAAVFGIVYMVSAGVLIRRFFARAPAEPDSFPPVTIIKPLRGQERMLLDNLSSFCRQDYPGPVQFLFGVQDSGDPALEILNQLRLVHPEAQITVVSDSRLSGANRKMSNILNMLPQVQHDVLVFADSDVGVEPGYLRHVVGELQKPDVGLVTCLYRGRPSPGLWPRLSAMATNYQFVPAVVTGLALGLARPCFGQTIATRRATVERIGGFLQFAHHLAEDHAIGKAVREAGEKVAIPPFFVTHACVEADATELLAHELRWSRTIRTIDPIGHLGSVLTYPLIFSALATFASGGAAWSLALVLTAVLARLLLKWQIDHATCQPYRDAWLLPIWDFLSFCIFVASFFSRRVVWRGFSFEVSGNGLLHPVKKD